MTIKKSYIEIVTFLSSRQNIKVGELLEEVKKMCESKKKDSTIRKDEKGNITYVFCYYHKVWENIKECEYGPKASSHSGLNTMCKIGVNAWTKQYSNFKKGKEQILDDVSKGTLKPQDIQEKIKLLEKARDKIVPRK